MLEFLKEAGEVIHQDIDLERQDISDDVETLLAMIEKRVTQLIETDDRLLFSYLYRLDISEAHLRQVMRDNKVDKIKAISKLILERQIARLRTKKQYPQEPIEGWEW